ncbi:MAG: UDP-3-O-(3-hydroxymyristoyl)glucosamine N-acyltransferase [Gammaproteobacteria bacterium]|nr:UDP-3-O-(3-hydroxymyristoyl)glucosamine N-acyltransferase [Gammaproteobacteria bacterium]MDH5628525.1 UDP-3-O-(3-hydroxymyristoyl)glucosamine N-acyltransferase [Gammaproteobacteria bacterium]
MQTSFSVAELAKELGAEYVGDGEKRLTSISTLEKAVQDQVTFLNNPKYRAQLGTTQAGCVLLSEEFKKDCPTNCIILSDPYLGFAKVAQLMDTTPIPEVGIHPDAIIDSDVKIGKGVSVAAGCVLQPGCIIEDNVILEPNVVVGINSRVGKGSRLFANVVVYHNVSIGQYCIIHAGAVIGSDGFGFANDKGRWVKIPQTGGVKIGDNVEIGANACIDRGALEDTIIGHGVKLDNLCHIAHNVELGENVAMAAYSAVAGSTKVGDGCTFGGRATILGHLNIAAGSHVTATSLINRSINESGAYSSGTGMQDNKSWRKSVARFRQLDEMAKQIKQLEKQLKQLQGK